jgi:solute carrier family 25 phosphate transporter 23/24/25/41
VGGGRRGWRPQSRVASRREQLADSLPRVLGLEPHSGKKTGAIDCIVQTIKQDGFWKGMYRGLVPNFAKIVPSMAVSFYAFDTVNDFLNSMYPPEDDDDLA